MAKQKYYEIIFEDEAIVVLNKFAQVLTIPDRHKPDLVNLYNLLQAEYGEIFIVHRLDRDTSGVLIFAKTAAAHKHLNDQFVERRTIKKYLALVNGTPFQEEARIEAALVAHPSKSGLMMVANKGKASTTDYKIVEKFKNYSLLECSILTGRTHQIRVHLKHIGHPLCVDLNYGGAAALYLSDFKKRKFNLGKLEEEQPMLTRVPLHAFQLTLEHPVSGETMTFEAELPKDLRATLNQLGKWNKA